MDTERCILYFEAYYTTTTEEDFCEALLAVHFLMDFLVKNKKYCRYSIKKCKRKLNWCSTDTVYNTATGCKGSANKQLESMQYLSLGTCSQPAGSDSQHLSSRTIHPGNTPLWRVNPSRQNLWPKNHGGSSSARLNVRPVWSVPAVLNTDYNQKGFERRTLALWHIWYHISLSPGIVPEVFQLAYIWHLFHLICKTCFSPIFLNLLMPFTVKHTVRDLLHVLDNMQKGLQCEIKADNCGKNLSGFYFVEYSWTLKCLESL